MLHRGSFAHAAAGITGWLHTVDTLRQGQAVALIYEATKHGPIDVLLEVAWIELLPVGPVKTNMLRKLHSEARGTSDRRDSDLLHEYGQRAAMALLPHRASLPHNGWRLFLWYHSDWLCVPPSPRCGHPRLSACERHGHNHVAVGPTVHLIHQRLPADLVIELRTRQRGRVFIPNGPSLKQ